MTLKITGDYLTITERDLVLKLRSLGAGVEDANETKISLLEAAYFADRGVLPFDKKQLIAAVKKKDKLAEEKYFTIKYLRDRGYIVRPSLDGVTYLRLHRKGYRPGEDKTYQLIEVVKKNWKAEPKKLQESLEAAARVRKELVIAIVDPKDDAPKFIKFSRVNLG